MSEMTTLIPWLDQANDLIIKQRQDAERERQRLLEERAQKDRAERERKLEIFKESLEFVLGQKPDTFGIIRFDEDNDPYVESGGYLLLFSEKRASHVWRLFIAKPVPERLYHTANGRRWLNRSVETIEEVARELRWISEQERRDEEAFARQMQEEAEQMKATLEPPMDEPRAEPVQPVLTHQQRLDARWLKRIANDIENGLGLSPIDEYILATVHFMQFIDDSD